jgi:anti-anti-sigma factor
VQITRGWVDRIPILHLAGQFVVWTDPDGTSLRAPIVKLVSEGHSNVLVHLGQVPDIDAHGLGQLAWGFTMLRQSGGRLALVAPCLWVRRLLALTRLDTILTVYDSELDAITGASAEVLPSAASGYGLTSRKHRSGIAESLGLIRHRRRGVGASGSRRSAPTGR